MGSAALTLYNCTYVAPTTSRNQLDGDTFRCMGNVSPIIPDSHQWVPKVRLVRINAPEAGETGANVARDALVDWLLHKPFNLICYARDKYGRLLADAERGEGLLSQYLLDHQLVVPMTVGMAKELVFGTLDIAQTLAIVHPQQLIDEGYTQ